ncbi:MAG: hypothetical protein EA397_13175 [Deltaproteobacteria bacterium]|nr:MAG: hypothetical protein EA397_13175 [Deltaproteobacteria bacterium]
MVHRSAPLISLAAVLGLACTPSEPTPTPTPAEPAPEPRDMLTVAVASDTQTLLPILSQSAIDSKVYSNLYFEGVHAEFDCSLKFRPRLVKAWTWGDKSRTLDLELRDDITWSDGTPVTAHDFVFAYELLADPAVNSPRVGYTEPLAGPPEARSDHALRFTYKETGNHYTRLSQATGYYLPKHLLADADRRDLSTHDIAKTPVPTGPFRLAEHKPGEHILIESNPNFSGPVEHHARLQRVQFRIIPDYKDRIKALKDGEIDLVDGLSVADADALRESHKNLRIEQRGRRFMDYVAWNLTDARFEDVRVRRAVAHAVNIDHMIDRLLKSRSGQVHAEQAVSSLTPELCAVRTKIEPIKQDVERARTLLEEAGWSDSDGDGVRDKDGVKLEFTLLTERGNDRRIQTAELLQANLKEIGIRVHVEALDFHEISDRLNDKDFEAALSGWAADLYIDPKALWHSGETRSFNFTSYQNKKVDELIERGLRTPDPAQAAPIWQEMQEIVYQEQPYLFLWWRDEIVAVDSRFQNTSIDLLSALHDLHRWEVPEDKVKHAF